jgi:hypothetical protein
LGALAASVRSAAIHKHNLTADWASRGNDGGGRIVNLGRGLTTCCCLPVFVRSSTDAELYPS